MVIEPGNPNLPAQVDGSVKNRRRWFLITTSNCDQHTFANFIDQQYCQQVKVENNPTPFDQHHVLMWDNLSTHTTPLVLQTLEGRRNGVAITSLNRPPYHPKYAPIEYVST